MQDGRKKNCTNFRKKKSQKKTATLFYAGFQPHSQTFSNPKSLKKILDFFQYYNKVNIQLQNDKILSGV